MFSTPSSVAVSPFLLPAFLLFHFAAWILFFVFFVIKLPVVDCWRHVLESSARKTINFRFLILLMSLIKHPGSSPGGRSFMSNFEELVISVFSYYTIDLGHLSLNRKLLQEEVFLPDPHVAPGHPVA